MKNSLTFLLIIYCHFITNSCLKDKNEIFYEGTVVISGQIENWNSSEGYQTISLINNDLASGDQQTFVERISNDGSFKFKIDIYHEKDIWLIFNKKYKTLFVHPGDSIFFKTSSDSFEFSRNFEGSSTKENSDLQTFKKKFDTFWKVDPDSRITELGALKYKEYIYELQLRLDSLYDSFIEEIGPEKEIADWAKIYLDYKCATELMAMVFKPNMEVPDEYWDFIDKYPLDNEKAVICSEYNYYFNQFGGYLFHIQAKNRDALDFYRQKDIYRYLKTITDTIVNNTSGIATDILLSNSYYSMLDYDLSAIKLLLLKYDSLVKNSYIRNQLHKTINSQEEILSNIDTHMTANRSNLSGNEFIGGLFNEIITKYERTILYVDIWATWCSPCLNEMPYSSILQSDYDDKNVSFIYLCTGSSPEKWESVIAEKSICGHHYYLDENQYSILKEKFQIQGIPRYMVIDKQGDIINDNAPRPSSEEIRDLLNNLLKE